MRPNSRVWRGSGGSGFFPRRTRLWGTRGIAGGEALGGRGARPSAQELRMDAQGRDAIIPPWGVGGDRGGRRKPGAGRPARSPGAQAEGRGEPKPPGPRTGTGPAPKRGLRRTGGEAPPPRLRRAPAFRGPTFREVSRASEGQGHAKTREAEPTECVRRSPRKRVPAVGGGAGGTTPKGWGRSPPRTRVQA